MSEDVMHKQSEAVGFPLPIEAEEEADTPDAEVLTATPDTALTPDGDAPTAK